MHKTDSTPISLPQVAAPSKRSTWLFYVIWTWCGSLLGIYSVLWAMLVTRAGNLHDYLVRWDFLDTYLTAKMIAGGQGALLYDLVAQKQAMDAVTAPEHFPLLQPSLLPPYFSILAVPLSMLSYEQAFLVNDLLDAGMIALGVYFLGSLITANRREQVTLALIAASFLPAVLTLLHAQPAALPFLGFAGAVTALKRRRDGQAGLWLLLVLVKPQYLLLPVLLLLVNKRWRALSTLAGGTVCLLGLCFAVLGNWVPSYWALLTREQGGGAEVAAFPQAMHNFRAFAFALGLSADAQSLVRLCLTLAALAVAAWICWPRKSLSTAPAAGTPDFDVRFSLLLLLGLLISPHTYLHDLLLWLVAGVLLLGAARRLTWPPTRGLARILSWLLWAGSPLALLGYQVWLFYPLHLTVTYMLIVILLGVLLLACPRQVLTAR